MIIPDAVNIKKGDFTAIRTFYCYYSTNFTVTSKRA